jgi:hypothetical protein
MSSCQVQMQRGRPPVQQTKPPMAFCCALEIRFLCSGSAATPAFSPMVMAPPGSTPALHRRPGADVDTAGGPAVEGAPDMSLDRYGSR